ncbi:unnamed protein product [Calypogeia fissa]
MPGIAAVPVENEAVSQRQLFGGSISCSFPARFQDVSDIRDVPSNQEVFVDPNRDESVIVELLELKEDVNDQSSASWFLEDLASEQDAKEDLVVEAGGHLSVTQVPLMDPSTIVNSAVGTLAVSKARESVEACNSVRVHLANMRLKNVQTDLLITVYQPLVISEHSSSAAAVGVVGSTIPAEHAGFMSVPDIFSLMLRTFKIEDWGLFG